MLNLQRSLVSSALTSSKLETVISLESIWVTRVVNVLMFTSFAVLNLWSLPSRLDELLDEYLNMVWTAAAPRIRL